MTTFVIVGGGLAGAKAAETLRNEGFDGDIVLFGDETERPYERPALAKGYLLGKDERDSVFVHSADWYAEHKVDLRLGTPVTSIDRAARSVGFDGGTLVYDKLALTTGASARRIPIPGADLGNVLYLRTLAESEALRAAFSPAAKVVIIKGRLDRARGRRRGAAGRKLRHHHRAAAHRALRRGRPRNRREVRGSAPRARRGVPLQQVVHRVPPGRGLRSPPRAGRLARGLAGRVGGHRFRR